MTFLARIRTSIAKAVAPRGAQAPFASGGSWRVIHDPYPGAWQQNREVSQEDILRFSAVYACIDLISNDIAKIRPRVVMRANDFGQDYWKEVEANDRPLVRRPNRYQTRIQFLQEWIGSKLAHGNTYCLAERGGSRGAPVALYVLDPRKVDPMVTPMGEVYYRVKKDWLAGLDQDEDVYIPASEIAHDRGHCPHHPLIGVSPLYAGSAAASLGVNIGQTGNTFFSRSAMPSGILSAPGSMDKDAAASIKHQWETSFSGENAGRIAILGNNLKFEQLTMKAVDAQQREQMKDAAEEVARVFHVPAHKIGAGAPPTFNNIAAMNQAYFTDCLQIHVESIETLLDELFDFGPGMGWDFDVEAALMRMDPTSRADANQKGISAGFLAPNEARASDGRAPVKGGETPYLQQQYWPIGDLTGRPVPGTEPAPAAPAPADDEPPEPSDEEKVKELINRVALKAAAKEGVEWT